MFKQLIFLAGQPVPNYIMKTGLGEQPEIIPALPCTARNSLSVTNFCPSGVLIVLLWISESTSPMGQGEKNNKTSQIKVNPARMSSSIFQWEKESWAW